MTIASPDAVDVTDTRERILHTAYDLYTQNAFRAVSTGEILSAAAVNEAEFLTHFASTEALAEEVLQKRERDWTVGTIEAGARERGNTPEECLLAIFDVFEDWFGRDDFEACTFINVLLEMGREHPLGVASVRYLVHIRDMVARLAQEAHLRDPGAFALSFHILMKGSIISAFEGDVGAARRAKAMAGFLLKEHRPQIRPVPTLSLVATETLDEWMVLDSDWQTGQPAAAIIRTEADGTYYYPYSPEFERIGPLASTDEAFANFRDDTYPELW